MLNNLFNSLLIKNLSIQKLKNYNINKYFF